jgi:hypothetical protein
MYSRKIRFFKKERLRIRKNYEIGFLEFGLSLSFQVFVQEQIIKKKKRGYTISFQLLGKKAILGDLAKLLSFLLIR